MKLPLSLLTAGWLAALLWGAYYDRTHSVAKLTAERDSLRTANAVQMQARRDAQLVADRYAGEAMWAEGQLNQLRAQCW